MNICKNALTATVVEFLIQKGVFDVTRESYGIFGGVALECMRGTLI